MIDADGHLRGIVSRGDLLKVFLRDDEQIAEEVRGKIVGYLFPAPTDAVRVEVADGVVTPAGRIADTSRARWPPGWSGPSKASSTSPGTSTPRRSAGWSRRSSGPCTEEMPPWTGIRGEYGPNGPRQPYRRVRSALVPDGPGRDDRRSETAYGRQTTCEGPR